MSDLVTLTDSELLSVSGGSGQSDHRNQPSITVRTGAAVSVPIVNSNANSGIQLASGNQTFLFGFGGILT